MPCFYNAVIRLKEFMRVGSEFDHHSVANIPACQHFDEARHSWGLDVAIKPNSGIELGLPRASKILRVTSYGSLGSFTEYMSLQQAIRIKNN